MDTTKAKAAIAVIYSRLIGIDDKRLSAGDVTALKQACEDLPASVQGHPRAAFEAGNIVSDLRSGVLAMPPGKNHRERILNLCDQVQKYLRD